MKRMLLLLAVALPCMLSAQNILENGYLEDPTAFALDSDMQSQREYFHSWHSMGERNPVYLYDTDAVAIEPVDGLGVVRFAAYETGKEMQIQHLVGQLSEAMQLDRHYRVTFHIALDRTATHATNPFEFYFSDRRDESGKKISVKYVINDQKPITNMRWRKVSFVYTPKGGERYFHIKMEQRSKIYTLENLNVSRYDTADDSLEVLKGAHYYLDAISIEPTEKRIGSPFSTGVAVAMILDKRESHARLEHNFEEIQKRLDAMGNVVSVSVLLVNKYASVYYRGSRDSLNLLEVEDYLVDRLEYYGSGNLNDALLEAYNSIVEFGLNNKVVVLSEDKDIDLPSSYKNASVEHWNTQSNKEMLLPEKVFLNAAFEPFKNEIAKRKNNHYSFAIGAKSVTANLIKYLRSELSLLIRSVDSKDIVSLSSSYYGNLINSGVSPDTLLPIFYSKTITQETIKNKVEKPMYNIIDEIGDYKGLYDIDYHSDEHNHRVIGVSDTLVEFEDEEYPYDGTKLLSKFESEKNVTVHLAVFNKQKGRFDYYQLHRDVLGWVPCAREDLFPSNSQRDYYSYRYQNYVNDVSTLKK